MLNKKENYCTFVPDKIFDVSMKRACYYHDRQYRDEVKTRKTRKEADIQFKNDIYNEFKKKNKEIRGFFISWIYYFGVRIFGGKSWVTD